MKNLTLKQKIQLKLNEKKLTLRSADDKIYKALAGTVAGKSLFKKAMQYKYK